MAVCAPILQETYHVYQFIWCLVGN